MGQIRFNCPECCRRLVADEKRAGLTAQCPSCSKSIVIPRLPTADHGQNQSAGEDRPYWRPPEPRNKQEYVSRCLKPEFQDEKETRTPRDDPVFLRVLNPLNSQRYEEAIAAARELLPRYRDFDLPYKWLGSAYRLIGRLDSSRATLAEGLKRCRRKVVLLTDIGETEWYMRNIAAAVYAWSQAVHCLSASPIDYNAYLLLSYVAKGVNLEDCSRAFLAKVDSLRAGEVRLEPRKASDLAQLASEKQTEAISNVINQLQLKYLPGGGMRDHSLRKLVDTLIERARDQELGALYPLDPSKGVYVTGGSMRLQSSLEVTLEAGGRIRFGVDLKRIQREVILLRPRETPENEVLWKTVEALKDSGAPGIQMLIQALDSETSEEAASWALVEIGEPAIPLLLAGLVRYAHEKGACSFNVPMMAATALIIRNSSSRSVVHYLRSMKRARIDAALALHLASLVGDLAYEELARMCKKYETQEKP